ncbi:MAG: GNAT family N-acetyltransferase [Acidobacteriota bacterium]
MIVAPLPEARVGELEEILEEEVGHWEHQLYWDFKPAVEVLRRYLSSRSLPGRVLRTPGREVVGYAYHVVDQTVGYIGNIYVRDRFASPKNYERLLVPTIHSLRAGNNIKRIECQIFPFNFNLEALFLSSHFAALKRHFLCLPLERMSHNGWQREPPAHFKILGWDPSFFMAAAEVIFDSYRDSADHRLCRDYQSLRGCVRFLRNLIESPGCGVFAPETSLVAVDDTGAVSGVLLTSLIGPRTGMVPQVSVRKASQGEGLGTLLLNSYCCRAQARDFQRVALSVSEVNQGAYRLYRRLGFEELKLFHAFIWDSEDSGAVD